MIHPAVAHATGSRTEDGRRAKQVARVTFHIWGWGTRRALALRSQVTSPGNVQGNLVHLLSQLGHRHTGTACIAFNTPCRRAAEPLDGHAVLIGALRANDAHFATAVALTAARGL